MRVFVIHDKPGFAAQITYTFDVLLSSLGVDHETLVWPIDSADVPQLDGQPVILYGADALQAVSGRHRLHIYSSDLFGPHYLTAGSLPSSPLDWVRVGGQSLPVLYGAREHLRDQPILATTSRSPLATYKSEESPLLSTNLDIVASSFFMLSRYEEALSQERDSYDRFPLEASLAFREGFLRTPVVNLYARLLGEWLSLLTDGRLELTPASYPGGRSFGLCLTHDVDSSRKFTPVGLLKTVGKVALRREGLEALQQIAAYLLTRRDPFWNFEQIIDLERTHGFKSSFFLSAGRHNKEYDPPYGDHAEERARLCETILNLEGEVGLHGSFESYASAKILGDELAALRQHAPVIGGRQHFLRLDTQRSFRVMEQAGLLYDCTLGFSRELGFRSGFSGPHYAFDLAGNRPIHIVEIPLVIMDRSLWSFCCQGLAPEVVWAEMLQVLEAVRDSHGCASVLWHNGFFDEAAYPGYGALYRRLLAWLQESNGWGAAGRQVYDWFVADRER